MSIGYSDNKIEILKLVDIEKNYGSVQALKNINCEIYKNEIVGLVGDNGAGKTTLIKIIAGNISPSAGKLFLNGKEITFRSPMEAKKYGIETVYQDLSLCENLDSAANLFIGREIYKKFLGINILQKREMEKRALQIMSKIGINVPSMKEKVEYLSGGQRQSVALGRFVEWGENLILLDEPTAALGVQETKKVLDLVLKVRKEKLVSMILISHNLQQIFEIVDRIIVLRHGEIAGIKIKNETNPDEIVSLITGADLINKPVVGL